MMKLNDLQLFLESGSLVVKPQGDVYLYADLHKIDLKSSLNFDVFAPSFYSGPRWDEAYEARKKWVLSRTDLQKLLTEWLGPDGPRRVWKALEFSDYEKSFQRIQRKLAQNEIEKAVPTLKSRSEGGLSQSERVQILRRLLQADSNSYVYGFWTSENPGYGYLGLTPEILFSTQRGADDFFSLETMALAGTQAVGAQPSLLSNERILREHGLVSREILQTLQSFGTVSIEGPYVAQLPHLEHLRTDITLRSYEPLRPLQLTGILHPTPALGVFPKAHGVEWMKTLSHQEDRENFGAPTVFYISNAEYLAVVNIRNIQWNSSQSWIETGGGVVRGSEARQEFDELKLKQKAVKSFLFGNVE